MTLMTSDSLFYTIGLNVGIFFMKKHVSDVAIVIP